MINLVILHLYINLYVCSMYPELEPHSIEAEVVADCFCDTWFVNIFWINEW